MSGRAARATKQRKALAKARFAEAGYVYQSGGFLVIHAKQLQWIDANDMPPLPSLRPLLDIPKDEVGP
jgi:hypothetical protein